MVNLKKEYRGVQGFRLFPWFANYLTKVDSLVFLIS